MNREQTKNKQKLKSKKDTKNKIPNFRQGTQQKCAKEKIQKEKHLIFNATNAIMQFKFVVPANQKTVIQKTYIDYSTSFM